MKGSILVKNLIPALTVKNRFDALNSTRNEEILSSMKGCTQEKDHTPVPEESEKLGEKAYTCKQCEKSFGLQTGAKPHTGTQCEKTFANHTGEKPHSTQTCEKSGAKPHTCTQCEKMFANDTGEKPHSTQTC